MRGMYVVILAGGGGTRLWPLSRPDRPKPFLPLLGEETLFQRTVRRLAPLVDSADIFVVADRRYGHLVQDQEPEVRLIVEPGGRNTAAAIALATAAIERDDDEVMIVLPADHWIRNEEAFLGVLAAAESELARGALDIESPLVTLGVQPNRPATEYGYLIPDQNRRHRGRLTGYALRAFEEKPEPARAVQLLNEPGVAWNAGMFLWRRDAIRAALEKYTPLMMLIGTAVGSDLALAGAYERIQPISIDYAVMEGAARDHKVVMGAMDVGWSDLGSWTALLQALAGGGPLDGRVGGRAVQPGDAFEAGPDDLVIRPVDGRLEVSEPPQGTIVPDAVWAHLTAARHLGPQVQALLDRVQREETRA
jgi:mannose-1-phosphate guanylyltransferase